MKKKLSSAQIRVWEILKDNEGSFVKSSWGASPQLISVKGQSLGFAQRNTIESMKFMLNEIPFPKVILHEVLPHTHFYQLKTKEVYYGG